MSAGNAPLNHSSTHSRGSQRQWIAKIVELGNRQAHDAPEGNHYNSADECIPASKQKAACPHCNIELLKRTLPRHIRTTHGGVQATHPCSICHLVFARKDSFERHLREQHSEGKVRCGRCGVSVGYRALKGHRQTQKCKDTRRSTPLTSLNEAHELVSTHVNRQPDRMPLVDPLVVIASFHRLVLAAWLDASPCFTSKDFTESVSLHFGLEDKDEGTGVTEGPIIPQMGMLLTLPPHAWMLRSLALTQTREMLARRRNRRPSGTGLGSVDDSLIRVMLLNSADQVLFGHKSLECQSHNGGLVKLLESNKPTSQFRGHFEELLEYAWRAIGGPDGSMSRYNEKPLIALLKYRSLLDYRFWYDPVAGGWVVQDGKAAEAESMATHE